MNRLVTAAILWAAAAGMTASLTVIDHPSRWLAAAQKAKQKNAAPPAKPQVATPPDTLKVAKGFKVELLYSVPKDVEGSWVNLCVDPKGRLIVSDQYGALYRITPPPVGQAGEVKLEKIKADIGMAQGLLWAFDALYVVVNAKDKSGLYKVTASQGDDTLDTVQLLRAFEGGGGEHGPHAVLKHPDGKRLTVVCGNQTKPAKYDTTRVPPHFGEDHLLPRLPDGKGFMKGVIAPGGCVYNVTPDGKTWELFSIGFRNQYDAAYNLAGDLFTYDADMEWDVNTPWYRPTRVCHVTSGSDWGWRNGAGKYPVHYLDTLPPVVNVGPGSPTGVCFGYSAKFPAKYQTAFFICDWSYGKLYACHLSPKGSSYDGTLEEFVSGTPLPLTDVVVNPNDGAMYITIGGRKTQSGLYRVTYVGAESTAPIDVNKYLPTGVNRGPSAWTQRVEMEKYHGQSIEPAFRPTLTANLTAPDRFIRFAARSALEFQDQQFATALAFESTDPAVAIPALFAVIRKTMSDPLHRTATETARLAEPIGKKTNEVVRQQIATALGRIEFPKLSAELRSDYLRVYQVFFNRFGPPTGADHDAVLAKFHSLYPTGNWTLDGMLCELLVYLDSPSVGTTTMKLIADAPTQEEQLEYVRSIRMLKAGWTPALRQQYFEWFVKAANYKGGNSLQGFLQLIKDDAVAGLTADEKKRLQPILDAKPSTTSSVQPPRAFVQKWTVAELTAKVEPALNAGGRDYDKGRKLFAATSCFACHRYDNEGGSNGPDLTGVAGRFSIRDLLESIIDPSKEISDQYAAVEIDTLDGKKIVGRIVNLNGDNLMVNTDMLNPNGLVTVNRNNVEALKPSKLSMMPAGLIDTLTADEATDLMAYLLSRGDRGAKIFKK